MPLQSWTSQRCQRYSISQSMTLIWGGGFHPCGEAVSIIWSRTTNPATVVNRVTKDDHCIAWPWILDRELSKVLPSIAKRETPRVKSQGGSNPLMQRFQGKTSSKQTSIARICFWLFKTFKYAMWRLCEEKKCVYSLESEHTWHNGHKTEQTYKINNKWVPSTHSSKKKLHEQTI